MAHIATDRQTNGVQLGVCTLHANFAEQTGSGQTRFYMDVYLEWDIKMGLYINCIPPYILSDTPYLKGHYLYDVRPFYVYKQNLFFE